MSKIEINKEIVLMRHSVRQARVNVIRKLVREVKALRGKRGTEIQRNKYKRKADRLTKEVLAAKEIQDDDISKFVITNKKSLQDVLADQTSDAKTRVTVKLGNHKSLVERVAKFKEKFPSYEEHLGPGRKKIVKLQRKARKEGKKLEQAKELQLESNEEKMIDTNAEGDHVGHSEIMKNQDTEGSDDVAEGRIIEEDTIIDEVKSSDTDSGRDEVLPKCDLKPGSILRIQPKKKSVKQEKLNKNDKSVSTKIKPHIKVNAPKIISKEATVKRFTELLQEERSGTNFTEEISTEVNQEKFKIEKEVDPFFMTGDGDTEYLSVAVPKTTVSEENEEWGNNKHSGNENSRKIFSKGTFFTNIEYSKYNSRGDWRNESGPQKRPGRDFTSKMKSRNDFGSAKKVRTEFPNRSESRSEKVTDSGDKNLHPSWAARKKQQELLKQGFQGQKIVFTDD